MQKERLDTSFQPTTPDPQRALAELKQAFQRPIPPVPTAELELLFQVACLDTGSSQVVRSFLFWLAGQPDPTGFVGAGGLELRRLDGELRRAALDVLRWWSGPTQCDRPLYDLLHKLGSHFELVRSIDSADSLTPSGGKVTV